MFKVKNKDTRITTSCVFIVNFDHISHLFLMFPLLNLSMYLFARKVYQYSEFVGLATIDILYIAARTCRKNIFIIILYLNLPMTFFLVGTIYFSILLIKNLFFISKIIFFILFISFSKPLVT